MGGSADCHMHGTAIGAPPPQVSLPPSPALASICAICTVLAVLDRSTTLAMVVSLPAWTDTAEAREGVVRHVGGTPN